MLPCVAGKPSQFFGQTITSVRHDVMGPLCLILKCKFDSTIKDHRQSKTWTGNAN